MFKLIEINWFNLLGILAGVTILSWGLTGLIKLLAERWRWYGHRATHHDQRQISRTGGLALFVILAVAISLLIDLTLPLRGLLLAMAIIVMVGLLDDLYDLPPLVKLSGQLVAVVVAVSYGIHIGQIANPFGGVIVLPPLIDYGLSIGWLLIMINTLNVLDGLDGLAAGMTAIFAVILLFLSLSVIVNQPQTATLAMILLGAVLGFLVWNWYPAKIFMGDAGSNLLGLVIGALAIISGAKLAATALVLGFPLLDLLWAAWRRWRQGRLPWAADREHLHHRLLAAGLSHPSVVLLILGMAALFGVISLLSGTWAKLIALVTVGLLMIILIRTIFFMQRR